MKTKICVHCKKEFVSKSGYQKFCCARCRENFAGYNIDLPQKNCVICQGPFQPRVKQAKLCGECRKLSQTVRKRLLKKTTTIQKCEKCGNDAVEKFKGEMLCATCLNAEPTAEYLYYEREAASRGQTSLAQYMGYDKNEMKGKNEFSQQITETMIKNKIPLGSDNYYGGGLSRRTRQAHDKIREAQNKTETS